MRTGEYGAECRDRKWLFWALAMLPLCAYGAPADKQGGCEFDGGKVAWLTQ